MNNAAAIVRAYPITTLISVLTDEIFKAKADNYQTLKKNTIDQFLVLKNKQYVIEYLKNHYLSEVSGSKPLSQMAAKHSKLVLEYTRELLYLDAKATFEQHRDHQKMIEQFLELAESIESNKQTSKGVEVAEVGVETTA